MKRLLPVLFVLAALPAPFSFATCGGGGGGGGGGAGSNPYHVQWTSWEEALRKDAPILLYCQTKPSEQGTLCCTKAAQELSKQYAFVKIPFAKTEKDLPPADLELLKAYAFDKKPAVLVMTDPWGNELARVDGALTEPKLGALFEQAKKDAKALEDRLARLYEKAKATESKGDVLKTALAYREVLKFKGCPAVIQAAEALKALAEKAKDALPKDLKTLRDWRKAFQDTDLAGPLDDAIQKLSKPSPAP